MNAVKNVLIVDDDPEFRSDCQIVFGDEFSVDDADNQTFREKIERKSFDLIFLDIEMPGKNGDKVYREIRQLDQRCAVIVVTNHPNHDSAAFFKARGIPVIGKGAEKFAAKVSEMARRYLFKEPAELSVLIIDDEIEQKEDFRHFLISNGVMDRNISWASSIGQAKSIMRDNQFDIYIIDMCFTNSEGRQEIRGHELVLQLLDIDKVAQQSVVLPITSKEEGRNRFECVLHENIMKPFYYDSKENLGHRIKMIMKRGPFRTQL
jgi:DNA-binding NtrC family response regulator